MTFLDNPQAIEERSYALIAAALGDCAGTPQERDVLMRIIHATGDHDYSRLIYMHPEFVTVSLAALRQGAGIFTDIEMVRSGINSGLAVSLGCSVFCAIREAEVIQMAKENGCTRAMAAMERLAPRLTGGLVVIGNAPTALFRLLQLMESDAARPAAVIGVPVGFVGAAEAKAALAETTVPHLVVRGTKGGSPVAVAAANALLRLAVTK